MRKKKGSNRPMRGRKVSGQLSLDMPTSRMPEVAHDKEFVQIKKEGDPKGDEPIICLEDAQRKRERVEESKHIRAIIDLVRHYK